MLIPMLPLLSSLLFDIAEERGWKSREIIFQERKIFSHWILNSIDNATGIFKISVRKTLERHAKTLSRIAIWQKNDEKSREIGCGNI